MRTESKKTLTQDYNQEGIKTIHGLAAVRKRPGMYVGSTQSLNGHNSHGLIQIAQEVLSNAIDEAYSGFGDIITFTIHKDNSVTVQDRGRGMPKGKNYDDVIRAVTVLHSSGKFDAKSYANSIGQNGVGIKATNALSKYIEVEAITTNKEHYYIKFNQEQVVEKKKLPYDKSMHTGTKITFLPDDTVFSTIDWEDEPLENKIEQSAYLTPKIKFIFTDERKTMSVPIDNSDTDSTESVDSSDSEISNEPDITPDESDSDNDSIPETKEVTYQKTWYSKHGLADYVAHLAEDEDLIRGLNKPIDFKGNYDYKTSKATGTIEVQGAIMYTDGSGENILSFANGAPTIDGGYHVDGAKQGVYQAIKDYINSNDKILKKNQSIDSQDTRDGLILALLVKIPENILQFESQSKTKLSTTTAKTATKNIIYDQFTKWLYDNPKLAKQIVQNMADSKNARITAIKAKKAAREARKTKNNNGKLYVSPKLRTATAKDPKHKEIYIVEGDSAASGLSKGRNPKTQAIFPIRGKILNTEGKKLSRVIKNQEISTIASVLKAGIGKDIFNPKDLDYDKIIIASDADPDGYAIRILLITLFFNFFPGLIENGHLYYVNAPLFKISHYVRGKQVNDYVYTEAERDQVVNKLPKSAKVTVSRFKGLGEMSTEESKKTLLDPSSRYLTRVSSTDFKASKDILRLIEGKKSAPRKQWIIDNVNFNETTE